MQLATVDNVALRARAEKNLHRLLACIARAETKIQEFDSGDLPAFHQWIARECADLVAEQEQLEEAAALLRSKLADVERLRQHGIAQPGPAYFWFLQLNAASASIPFCVQRAWQKGGFRYWNRFRSSSSQEASYGEPFVRFAVADDEQPERCDHGRAAPEHDISHGENCRYLYRRIVRLLHPDVAGVWSIDERNLWSAAQTAYQQRDASALEAILARSDRVGTRVLEFSELVRRVLETRCQLAHLRAVLRRLRAHRAWSFRAKTTSDRELHLRAIRDELGAMIQALRNEISALESRIERYRQKAERWFRRMRQPARRQLLLFAEEAGH
jgi:prefoldin subunit 5